MSDERDRSLAGAEPQFGEHSPSEHSPFAGVSRREFLKASALAGLAAAIPGRALFAAGVVEPLGRLDERARRALGTAATVHNLSIDRHGVRVGKRSGSAVLVNGSLPAPLLRFREGEDVVIHVTNHMSVDTSVHWHGFLVPFGMDGVPGFSYPGIKPGETFTYRFRIHQSGTYWYHSHSGGQEQEGVYGPIIIDPAERSPYAFDRDYVVLLSDWTPEPAEQIMAHLKKNSSWYNYQRRTVPQFFKALFHARSLAARDAIVQDRLMWAKMRMDATDISDVTGATYTYLVNGKAPEDNWTALFRAGERVRLRFINGSSMTFFDVRVPGLPMTVVQSDGQDIRPVTVDEMRLGVAETYDVIVEPRAGQAYTLFAQALDRSGYARGTIAETAGQVAPIPPMDPRPLRTMNMTGMNMGGMNMPVPGKTMPGATPAGQPRDTMQGMQGMKGMPGMIAMSDSTRADSATAAHRVADMPGMTGTRMPDKGTMADMPGMAHGDSAVAATPEHAVQAAHEAAGNPGAGRRKLTYTDLEALTPNHDVRPPQYEIVLHLTGDMARYFWTINGKKLSESEPIRMRQWDRVQIKMINETMMDHPMHLHGVFMEVQNGRPVANAPRKHTVIVPPFETATVQITALEPGAWAFHCHLLYHMMAGMFVKVLIDPAPKPLALLSALPSALPSPASAAA
ncbi:MAG: copper resistance system multicopper oxidase [Gemmatimonadaceae bacterium]